MLPKKRKFTKWTIKYLHPGCDKLVVNTGGLTQHMQAAHSDARRHPQQSPEPGPADHEQTPCDDNMQGDDGHEGCNSAGPHAYTTFHPLIDG